MITLTGLCRQDFHALRTSIVIGLALVLIGAATVTVAYTATREMQATYRKAHATRGEIQAKLARARDEQQEIGIKLARYREILARGYVGPENRLDWVERIRAIKAAHKLFDIEYELAPQTRVNEGATGRHELRSSNMKLTMQLLHEAELIGFLADLRAGVSAHLRIRGCNVERLPRSAERRAGATLKADCSIDWMTLRENR